MGGGLDFREGAERCTVIEGGETGGAWRKLRRRWGGIREDSLD